MPAIFFGVTIFLLVGNEGNAEAIILAGTFPINVWEAHSCPMSVSCFSFFIVVAYLLTVQGPFSCNQSLLIERGYYKKTRALH